MAEQEQNRSETATPYKLQEARKRGQVAKSLEANSLFALFGLLVVMVAWGRAMMQDQLRLDAIVFGQAHRLNFEASFLMQWLAQLFLRLLYVLSPLFLVLMVLAIFANMVQTGPIFTTFPLKPDIDRLNPITGFKRLFSGRLVFEIGKNLVKLALFSAALYFIVRDLIPPMLSLLQIAPAAYLNVTFSHAVDIVFKMTLVFALIALIDLVYTRWSYADKQKMSRREVRDEVKHREGDPRIRARMRELRRETLARSKAMRRLPEADVLITNPTHLAVALLYRKEKMSAPTVIAKGAGELAEQMRVIARRHRVPLVENRNLARALFTRVDVDQKIPDEFFATVARLLVWVYALRQSSGTVRQGASA
jgi:flagellar biosynthesis protein FlhB